MLKGNSLMWMALIVAILWSGHEGPIAQLTDMLRTVATVTRSAGGAAVLLFESSSGISIRASSAVLEVTASSLDVFQAAWHGVVLVQVRSNATGYIEAVDSQDLGDWLESEKGGSTTSAPAAVRGAWASLARSSSLSMPILRSSYEFFDELGSYESYEARIRLGDSGHYHFSYRQIQVRFRPQWANPMWDMLELNLSAEHLQIRRALDDVIRVINASADHQDTEIAYVSLVSCTKL